MKIKSIFAWVLALGMLSSCSKDDSDYVSPEITDDTVAYVSITIPTDGTRAPSTEDNGQNESDIKSLYLFTFDSNGRIIGVPGTTNYYVNVTPLGSDPSKPDAQKIAAKATQLLVIANPGAKLLASFGSINSSTTFATINAAITGAARDEITDDVTAITKGFTMINSGDEGDTPAAGDIISNPLINIAGKSYVVDGATIVDENAAIAAAQANRVEVKIERLASKIQVKEKTGGADTPSGAEFTFESWVVDGLNTTFYPYAEKTLLDVAHTSSLGYYVKNFYTKDPNFTTGTGVEFASVDRTTNYQPVFTQGMDWMLKGANATAYCIENTMDAAEQRFGNATRVVIKATYYPVSTWSGDWFSFAGINYETLADLKTAYQLPGATNLQNACDRMWDDIEDYAQNATPAITLDGTDFLSLTTADLDKITPGGEIIKSTTKDGSGNIIPCINWYQQGLNYYYNEIRHDDATNVMMAFAKYGVVRNNWYELTINSVSGAGTPWYPDINEPGPGDPDPTDPIDDSIGYLGIEVKVAPWIFWQRPIDL